MKRFTKERRLKLGVISNEFFDVNVGRMGGFGWAAATVARCFGEEPQLGVDVVFLTNELRTKGKQRELVVHNTRLVLNSGNRFTQLTSLLKERIDLLLSIDYNSGYRWLFLALPRTPAVIWVRDPRTKEDNQRLTTLRLPPPSQDLPKGVEPLDCSSMRSIVQYSRLFSRPVLFAPTTPYLEGKIRETFSIESPQVVTLPNIISLPPRTTAKSTTPLVVFLARLDPYKRPWIFTALAEHFPEVRFLMLGQSHFQGSGGWQPGKLPANVRLLGHADQKEKWEYLSSAWVVVNTSIHEGLAVSLLESLACETPILSCEDPEGIVSRFGICVGRHDGTGLDALPKFIDGLKKLLSDEQLRISLGQNGCAWVNATHNRTRFLSAFHQLCSKAGLNVETLMV